jgi:hypothetical protein
MNSDLEPTHRPIESYCDNCGKKWPQEPEHTLLGFRKVRCPECLMDQVAPLSMRVWMVWFMMALLLAFIAEEYIRDGQGFVPGLFTFGIVGTLVKDGILRYKRAQSWKLHEQRDHHAS